MFEKIISTITALFIGLVALVWGVKKPPTVVEQPETKPPPEISQALHLPKTEIPTSKTPKKEEVQQEKKQKDASSSSTDRNATAIRDAGKQTQTQKEPQRTEEPQKLLEPRPIDLRSVVGLACDFENKNKGTTTRYRGSGVIVREGTYSQKTYILTNRHVVDIDWVRTLNEDETIAPGFELTDCKVYVLRADAKILPEERYPYPYYDLRDVSGLQHDFKARLLYLPETNGLSENEEIDLDYAILEITEKNSSKYFEHENPRLPSVPVLVPNPKEWLEVIKESRVVMPGYAFQQSGSGSFQEFRLLTKDGIVKDVYAGDKTMQNMPISMIVEVPPDAYGGRSGSPIFYNGYLIGLVATKALPAPNSEDFRSPQPAITGIIENIKKQAPTKEIFEKLVSLSDKDAEGE